MNNDLRKQIMDENKRRFDVNSDAAGDMDTFFSSHVAPLRDLQDRGVIEIKEHRNHKNEVDLVDVVAINFKEF